MKGSEATCRRLKTFICFYSTFYLKKKDLSALKNKNIFKLYAKIKTIKTQ